MLVSQSVVGDILRRMESAHALCGGSCHMTAQYGCWERTLIDVPDQYGNQHRDGQPDQFPALVVLHEDFDGN